MRAVVQRVSSASVSVDGQIVGKCGPGLLVLVAAHRDDTETDAQKLADRVWKLRIFNDEDGKMNLSLEQLGSPSSSLREEGDRGVEGARVLAVSNFTVYGETAKNRRPSFIESAPYAEGGRLFNAFVEALRALDCPTETGVFGADMQVQLVNDGPVTVILDTR